MIPRGFTLAGVHAGLKPNGRPDVGLILSDRPCATAAVFTRNLVWAAPLLYDSQLLARNPRGVRALVINSKCANAVTGDEGLRNASRTADLVRSTCDLPEESEVFVMSTGVIGEQLKMDKIAHGIELAAAALSPEDDGSFAQAIMTTDTHPKSATRRLEDGTILTGFAKGAGMIHPDMATMLAVVLTDARLSPADLQPILQRAADRSFNCISVDGDTSTNDTLVVMASGLHETDARAFEAALIDLCQELARMVAFDGEGATKQVTIDVSGLSTEAEARQVGRTIATSPLVKTALYGRDANWGRILAAAGRAGVAFDPARADLFIGELCFLEKGAPVTVDAQQALEELSKKEIPIRLRLGHGPGSATVWTCDFSTDYVHINADYRT